MLARGEAFRRWLSDLRRKDLLPEVSAHERLGYRLPTPRGPADQGHWTRTGGLASGLRTATSASPHSQPNTGQG